MEDSISFAHHLCIVFLQFPQMSFCMTFLAVGEYIPVSLNHTKLPKTLLCPGETVLCI